MNKYTNELFEAITASFTKQQGGAWKDILKTVPENTYLVRLIPNVDDVANTLMQYYMHGWNASDSGRYTQTVCPTTYGEDCPICTERFRLWNAGDEESKEASKKFARKERYYANVYVVDDPVHPENNGTVKVYGYGRQLAAVIEDGLTGDDKDDVGMRAFDFTKNGCNLRIKVEKNKAGFPNYDRSKFTSPSAIEVTLEDVSEQMHDFDPLLTRKTRDEMEEMLAIETGVPVAHKTAPTGVVAEDKTPAIADADSTTEDADDLPMSFVKEDGGSADEDILAELENL